MFVTRQGRAKINCSINNSLYSLLSMSNVNSLIINSFKKNILKILNNKDNIIHKVLSSQINSGMAILKTRIIGVHNVKKNKFCKFAYRNIVTLDGSNVSNKDNQELKKSFPTNINSDTNSNQYNNVISNSSSMIEFDEYLKGAILDILYSINKRIKNQDLENFLLENTCFKKMNKILFEILRKSEDGLLNHLIQLLDTSNHSSKSNKINFIFTENLYYIKRKFVVFSLLSSLINEEKFLEQSTNSVDLKTRIFTGKFYERLKHLGDSQEKKPFTGTLIITKNFKDTLEYYEIFRKFDEQKKFKIKKFGSLNLAIKGNNLKKEQPLVEEIVSIMQENKKNNANLPE